MVSKKEKQNPPPPKPEEESSEEEEEEVEEEEEEEEEEVEEKEVEEEGHQEKQQPSSSSEAESESDEDDDQSTSHPTQPSVKNPSVQRQATPPLEAVPNSGSEEEETESEEEEEADPASESPRSATASAYTVKPITTVPVNSKVSKPTPKRPLESSKNDVKGSTDRKKAKTGEENDKKGKGAFPAGRVWSEENEIVVLQGMINYQKQKGPFRSADTGVFYEFIKGKLWDGVTKNQIADKLKRLKGKYLSNVKKGKNGQDPSFSKPHEKKAYELSKQVWGVGGESNGNEEKAKTKVDIGKGKKVSNAGSETKRVEDNSKVKSDNPKGKKGSNDGSALMDVDEDAKLDLVKDELKDDDEEDFLSKFPTLSKSFDAEMGFLKENLHLIGCQKARELEEKWKQLHLEEMDVLAKRLNLKHVQIKLVLDALKKQ